MTKSRFCVSFTVGVLFVGLPTLRGATPVASAFQAAVCGDGLGAALGPEAPDVQVLLVKPFKQGDAISLAASPPANAPRASSDVCLVKLLVGPGNAGPAGAPSTTKGVGLEVWLPSPGRWNGRIRAEAPGGFMGSGNVTATAGIGMASLASFAASEGTVTVVTDGGHADGGSGMFLTLPDGSPNMAGWKDLSHRAVHEMSVKTKALVRSYYQRAADRAYIYGCSSGGRAVYQSAQMYPSDFDGIVADAVSLDQTQYFPGLMYPQVVMQRDLASKGLPLLSKAKRDAVSVAALQACDATVNGRHDGYVTDFDRCTYDPTKDQSVLCATDGGTNATPVCVTKIEAQVVNKVWFGVTADGSVPDPSADNGTNVIRPSNQLWWGRKRGASLDPVMGFSVNGPALGILSIVVDQVAWNLQDLSLTRQDYTNAPARGREGWKAMSYAAFAQSFLQGRLMNEPVFANIDSNNPDLTRFRDAGGKMISMVGTSDPFVSAEAMLNYYVRSSVLVGGNTKAQDFHRLFLVPGRGHCGGTGSVGTGGNPPQVSADQMYRQLVDWVEGQKPPSTVMATSADGSKRRPLCMYPSRTAYVAGDVNAAASYVCR